MSLKLDISLKLKGHYKKVLFYFYCTVPVTDLREREVFVLKLILIIDETNRCDKKLRKISKYL